MLDPWEQMKVDAAATENNDDRLRQLKQLATDFINIDLRISEAEEEMKRLKTDRESLRRFRIPELMMELGITSVTANNRTCEITTAVDAKLPKEPEKKTAAIDWVVNHGHGGVVKRMLTVDLPKGDAMAEERVVDAVREAAPELPVDVTYDIHHSSYSALIRRLVKNGVMLPTETLGVTIETLAKISEK